MYTEWLKYLQTDLGIYDMITNSCYTFSSGGARGVMVIVVGNGLGDTSSNPGRDWLHFI